MHQHQNVHARLYVGFSRLESQRALRSFQNALLTNLRCLLDQRVKRAVGGVKLFKKDRLGREVQFFLSEWTRILHKLEPRLLR